MSDVRSDGPSGWPSVAPASSPLAPLALAGGASPFPYHSGMYDSRFPCVPAAPPPICHSLSPFVTRASAPLLHVFFCWCRMNRRRGHGPPRSVT